MEGVAQGPAIVRGPSLPLQGRFRSRAVEIDAWRIPCVEYGEPFSNTPPAWLVEAEKTGTVECFEKPHSSDWMHVRVKTLEGVMEGGPGDWIIRGTEGELYPCKATVFERKYEAV